MTTTDEITKDRDAIDALLPWYATGRLSAADAKRVEAAIDADPEMARRAELARDEMDETIRINEHLGAPSPRTIEQLFAKIDAEPKSATILRAVSAAAGGGFAGRVAGWLAGFAPRTLAYATVAGALALLLQAGVIGSLMMERGGSASYQTASYGKFEPADGAFVMVSFADGVTAMQVLEFLRGQNATIVDGPRGGNMFKLRVSPVRLDKAELESVVQRLRAQQSLVRLVLPTQ